MVLHVGHLNRARGVASLASLADLALPVLAASTTTAQDAALAGELGAAGVRLITQYVPQVAELYQLADVYLFSVPPNPDEPSSIDWPLSVLEAAACDLPILTTRFGALPEVWEGRSGVMFYDDEASLRSGLLRLRAHPAHTRPLAEPFSWQNAARHLLAEIVAMSAEHRSSRGRASARTPPSPGPRICWLRGGRRTETCPRPTSRPIRAKSCASCAATACRC